MKTYFFLLLGILLLNCDSEDVPACFRAAGDEEVRFYELPTFSKIRVENDITLFIVQGPTQEVRVSSGETIFPDLNVSVENDELVLIDESGCNLVRDYRLTTVTVTIPELTTIRHSSSSDIRSVGVLSFPSLTLISDTRIGPETQNKSGDFYLSLDVIYLEVDANGQSVFYLNGVADQAKLGFFDEYPRVEGAELVIQELEIFHRGAAPMIVHPVNRISGIITGTGDVIAVNRPDSIDIETRFTGRLRFE